ncbi:hypothetical protein FKM82_015545 [Ascaphus truei]
MDYKKVQSLHVCKGQHFENNSTISFYLLNKCNSHLKHTFDLVYLGIKKNIIFDQRPLNGRVLVNQVFTQPKAHPGLVREIIKIRGEEGLSSAISCSAHSGIN